MTTPHTDNVIAFPNLYQPQIQVKRPRGAVDVFSKPDSPMMLIDACVPTELALEFLRKCKAAGVKIRNHRRGAA